MKQQGSTWKTADGKDTLAKYLPKHDVLFEKLGQKIAAEAVAVEKKLRDARSNLISWCKEAMRNSPDKSQKTRFTFYTFDREYRIEYDIKTEYVRVYRSTKSNPSAKDYELINLDFNRSELQSEEQLDSIVAKVRDEKDFDGSGINPLEIDEIGQMAPVRMPKGHNVPAPQPDIFDGMAVSGPAPVETVIDGPEPASEFVNGPSDDEPQDETEARAYEGDPSVRDAQHYNE